MGLIITPKQWNTRPLRGVPINWGHPLTHGLESVLLCDGHSDRDRARGGAFATLGTGGSWDGATRFGPALNADGSASGGATYQSRVQGLSRMGGTIAQNSIFFTLQVETSATGKVFLFIPQTARGLFLHLATGTFSATDIAYKFATSLFSERTEEISPGLTTGANRYCITRNGTAVTLYRNGAYLAAATFGDAANYYDDASTIQLGSSADVLISDVMLYSRCLSAGEVYSLTDNPYQMFYSPRRYWFGAAAAVGGTVPVFMNTYKHMRT